MIATVSRPPVLTLDWCFHTTKTPSRHDSPHPAWAGPRGRWTGSWVRLRLNDCACGRKVIGVLLLGSAPSAVVASGEGVG